MKRVFLVAPMRDCQTGPYVERAFKNLNWAVASYDMRHIEKVMGRERMNEHIKFNLTKLSPKPDLFLVLKGLEVSSDTIDFVKSLGIKTACWIYDATLNGTPMPECADYIKLMNHYDTFYSYCNNIEDLKKAGSTNVKLLPEGYDPIDNGEQVINKYMTRKFGSDIGFIGSIDNIHPCREDFLERVIDEGFDIKIYGELKKENISKKILSKHQRTVVINEFHSYVSQASKICLGGLDSDFMVDESHSARIYRTLSCGGFYLCRKTNGIEKVFTPGVHIATFETEDEMIEKIIYYLNNPEEREKIAKAGQEKVKEYTFEKRIEKEFGTGKTDE